MDSLDCKICQLAFDEEQHKPQLASCGHGLCSVCLKELIVDKIFVCPKCRQEIQVDVPEDIPVNFDLIDVIRSFKSMKISLTNRTNNSEYGVSNDYLCKIHHRNIEHRCTICQLWMCNLCIDSHCKDIGCNIISSTKAMEVIKEELFKSLDKTLSIYEEDSKFMQSKIEENNKKIKEITDERMKLLEMAEKYGKEVTNFENCLEQGKILKENLMESKTNLCQTKSPYGMMDGIEVVAQMKQTMRSWSVKNLGKNTQYGLFKILSDDQDYYISMDINNKKMYGKLTKKGVMKYLHAYCAQNVPDSATCIPFEQIKDIMPPRPSLVFLELTSVGVVKGHVLLRLYQNLPNIRQYMVELVTGQKPKSLTGLRFDFRTDDCIRTEQFYFGDQIIYDSNATSNAKSGEVVCDFASGYMRLQYNSTNYGNDSSYRVVGSIEAGMDIMKFCYRNYSCGVKISNSGLVIE